jgi:hypothetical protein
MPAETNVDTTEIEEEEKVKTFKCYECESEFEEDEMQHNDDGDLYCYDCYHENYGACSECGVETSHDYIQFDERSEEYYCDGCLPHHGEDVDLDSYYSNVNIISPDNNTYVDNKFERAVGVEIETTGFEHSIDDFDCSEFDFKKAYDGSVNANNSEYKGVEYISKPMSGDYLFKQIDNIGNYLLDNDFEVNKSCGLHIHIDARDLFYEQLKGILIVAKTFEDIIFRMVPKSRERSRWCRKVPMAKHEITRIDSNSDLIQSWYESSDTYPELDKYNDSRYHGLNLHARVYLGTIEFRYHSGTNNPEKIKNWITICQSIVAKGIELGNEMEHKKTGFEFSNEAVWLTSVEEKNVTIKDFIKVLGLEQLRGYVIRRIHKFNGDNLNLLDDKTLIQDYLNAV